MALRWMDSMGGYADGNDVWLAEVDVIVGQGTPTVAGPLGTRAFNMQGTNTGYRVSLDPFITTETLIVGGYFWLQEHITDYTIIEFDNAGVDQCGIHIQRGFIGFFLGSGTEVEMYLGRQLPLKQWVLIEVALVVHNSTGSYEVRVDGETVLTATNVDTQADSTARVTSVNCSLGFSIRGYLGPMWIMDSTGSANNTFTNGAVVEAQVPNADGTRNDFTPLSGLTNYEMVDDALSVGSGSVATYIDGSTIGDDELYGFPSLAIGSARDNIHAVGSKFLCEKTQPGLRTVRTLVRSNAVELEGTRTIGARVGLQILMDFYEQNPDGPTAWTESTVNAAELGFTIEG